MSEIEDISRVTESDSLQCFHSGSSERLLFEQTHARGLRGQGLAALSGWLPHILTTLSGSKSTFLY